MFLPTLSADYLSNHPLVDKAISPRCVLAEFTNTGPKLALRVGACLHCSAEGPSSEGCGWVHCSAWVPSWRCGWVRCSSSGAQQRGVQGGMLARVQECGVARSRVLKEWVG